MTGRLIALWTMLLMLGGCAAGSQQQPAEDAAPADPAPPAGEARGPVTETGAEAEDAAPASEAAPADEAPAADPDGGSEGEGEGESEFPPKPLPPGKANVDRGAPLGHETNPVRCWMPGGEQEYLSRLRCADGSAPSFFRTGSYGSGPYGTIIDGYKVQCGKAEPVMVFMDMYHGEHVETEAVPGFTIVNR